MVDHSLNAESISFSSFLPSSFPYLLTLPLSFLSFLPSSLFYLDYTFALKQNCFIKKKSEKKCRKQGLHMVKKYIFFGIF